MKKIIICFLSILLLIACGDVIIDEPTNPPIPITTPTPPISSNVQPNPSLNENWYAFFETKLCDFDSSGENITIVIDLKRNNDLVTGKVDFYGIGYSSTDPKFTSSLLTGTINNNRITGQIDNTYTDGSTSQQTISLLWNNYKLEGSIKNQSGKLCIGQSEANWELDVSFLPELNDLVIADAFEDNDSIASAKEIQFDTTYDLSIEKDDIDWFKIITDQFIVAEITTDIYTFAGISIDAYSAHNLTDTKLPNINIDSLFFNTRLISLTPGINYIRAQTPTGINSEELRKRLNGKGLYKISLKKSLEYIEFKDSIYEPNENREQATPITTDFCAKNFSIIGGDVDWYSFSLTEKKLVNLFSKPECNSGPYANYQIYNSNLEEVYSNSVMLPGSYYIKVSQNYTNYNSGLDLDYTYGFSISTSSVPDIQSKSDHKY